jgi:hypothetical protein
MRVVTNLAGEFEDVCENYEAHGPQGRDMVTLIKKFGDEYDHLRSEEDPDFVVAWETFLQEHQHQMIVHPMTGLILYNLITYWDMGQMFYTALPTLEKMLVRDTVMEISDEIDRKSGLEQEPHQPPGNGGPPQQA